MMLPTRTIHLSATKRIIDLLLELTDEAAETTICPASDTLSFPAYRRFQSHGWAVLETVLTPSDDYEGGFVMDGGRFGGKRGTDERPKQHPRGSIAKQKYGSP